MRMKPMPAQIVTKLLTAMERIAYFSSGRHGCGKPIILSRCF